MFGFVIFGMHVTMAGQTISEEQGSARFCTIICGTAMWGPSVEKYYITSFTMQWNVFHCRFGLFCDHATLVQRNDPRAPTARNDLQRTIVHGGIVDSNHGR